MVDFTPASAERQRPLQLARPRAIILDEVDRLGDVAVRLRPRLARLVDDPGRQLVASLAQQRGHPTEDLGPRLRAGVAPRLERAPGRRHRLIDLGSPGGGHAADDFARARGIHGDDSLLRLNTPAADHERLVGAEPRPDGCQGGGDVVAHGRAGEIRVRLVVEVLRRRGRRRHDSTRRIRQQRLRRLALGEAAPQERLVRRVLQQPPHEIRHARDQLAERHVDAHPLAALGERAHQRLGHAVQRLELDASGGQAIGLARGQRVGDRADVVAADGEIDRVGVLEKQAGEALERRVRLGLRLEHGHGPVLELGVGGLVVPVRALHQTHAHRRAAPPCPRDEPAGVRLGIL